MKERIYQINDFFLSSIKFAQYFIVYAEKMFVYDFVRLDEILPVGLITDNLNQRMVTSLPRPHTFISVWV